MNIVVDANILFSALLKHGVTAEILLRTDVALFAPEFIFEEFNIYKEELLSKTSRTDDDFFTFLTILKRRISILPYDDILPFLETAKSISPDEKDTVYLALALRLQCAMWSNDKALKEKQDVIKVFHTHELLSLLDVA